MRALAEHTMSFSATPELSQLEDRLDASSTNQSEGTAGGDDSNMPSQQTLEEVKSRITASVSFNNRHPPGWYLRYV